MTYNEAKYKINNIKEAAIDFQNSINKVEEDLINKAPDLATINSSISNKIGQDDIVYYSNQAVGDINDAINNALSISASALSQLTNDANEEIKKIVDAYNNSIVDKEDEPPKPRLSYETISLSSKASSGSTSTNTPPGGYYGSSGNNSGGNNHPPIVPQESFESLISQLSTGNINSDNIVNWEAYVNNFLVTYDLSDSILSIKIEGTKVICKLKNGKEVVIENINNISELVSKIKENL